MFCKGGADAEPTWRTPRGQLDCRIGGQADMQMGGRVAYRVADRAYRRMGGHGGMANG